MVKARTGKYWSRRRSKQGGRALRKGATAFASPSVKNIAQAAWSGVKYLRTLVNSEVHKLDTSVSTAIDTSGYLTHLTAIGQGDGITQRTGQSVLLSYLSVRGVFAIHASATTSQVRVLVLCDKQQVADTAPAVTDVLVGGNYLEHYNVNTVGRFNILEDETFALSAQGPQQMIYRRNFTLNTHHVRFNGSATTDIQRGGIYILLVGNEGTNLTSTLLKCRVSFHDN